MRYWPKGITACINCTGDADRYSYGANGLCGRCYELTRRIEQAESWDRQQPQTLKRVPLSGIIDPASLGSRGNITDHYTNADFEVFRRAHIRQFQRRLERLRLRESIRRHEISVDGLSLEGKFGQLLRLLRPGARYPMNASYLNQEFNEHERRVIYALLEEVIEQIPWRGVNWYEVLEAVSDAERNV